MAFRIRYKCSDEKCRYTVGLATLFPIWRKDTPANLAKVPVGVINKAYVGGYYDEKVCLVCHKTVPVAQGETKCPECGAKEQFMEIGGVCPSCGVGEVIEDKGRRVSF